MSKKYKRSANGCGTVSRLPGNRRRPWRAMSPAVEGADHRFRRRLLGCFETRQEAIDALTVYRLKPPAKKADFTLEQLYAEWSRLAYHDIDQSTVNNYRAAWKHVAPLHRDKVKELRSGQMQEIVNGCADQGLSRSTLEKVKLLLVALEEYARQNDIIDKNYAEFVKLPKAKQEEKPIFTDLQMQKLKEAAKEGVGVADLILVMCYTGWRIQEFCSLTVFDWNPAERTLFGGMKTDAGFDRLVYVPEIVLPIVQKYADQRGPALFCWVWNNRGKGDRYREELRPWPVKRLRAAFYDTLEQLHIEAPKDKEFTPHCTRHTYNSMLDREGVPQSTRMKLMGQTSAPTNRKYTHVELQQMQAAANLLK